MKKHNRITGVERRLHRAAIHIVSLDDENNQKDTDQKSDRDKLDGVKEHIKSALFLLRLLSVLLLRLSRFLVSFFVFVRLFFIFVRLFFALVRFFFIFVRP